MDGYQLDAFDGVEFSIAFTRDIEEQLDKHFIKGNVQEDVTFAYWRPSRGATRYTAIIHDLPLPADEERLLQGNVSFLPEYLARVLDGCPTSSGIALLHSHVGPGWQDMSEDDIVAERDRLAGVVAGRTGLPLVGLTWSTSGVWSGRFWLRASRRSYQRRWATTVRSVGRQLRVSYQPDLSPPPSKTDRLVATRSVWGEDVQDQLARTRVGIVGLGSVGSLVSEALSRTGLQQIVLIDHDIIEERNLDRTIGALRSDVEARTSKVALAKRQAQESHTAEQFTVTAIEHSLLSPAGLAAVLDCDVIISCVDRPWPTHILNKLAYLHLMPVIDGGILARVNAAGALLHVDWTIQTVGPSHACLYCLDALCRSDVVLDRDGSLDDPDYIKGLSLDDRERYQRRNVFSFSMSVAAHEVLQLVGLVSGNARIGGIGPQRYRAYPGLMEVGQTRSCDEDCDVAPLTGSAGELVSGISVAYGIGVLAPPPVPIPPQTRRGPIISWLVDHLRPSRSPDPGQ